MPSPITDVLRSAIQASDLSVYEIAKRSGVSHQLIYQFLSGPDRHIRTDAADAIASTLRLTLRPDA